MIDYIIITIIIIVCCYCCCYCYCCYFLSLEDDDFDSGSSQGSLSRGKVSTISSREVELVWGHSEHLTGLLSTVCVFSDVLTMQNAQTLHHYGDYSLHISRGVVCLLFLFFH